MLNSYEYYKIQYYTTIDSWNDLKVVNGWKILSSMCNLIMTYKFVFAINSVCLEISYRYYKGTFLGF